jgi:hypothetical protein
MTGEKGDEVVIKGVTGVKAVGKAAAGDDDNPRVELVFAHPFQLTAWDYYGQNVSSRVNVLFANRQLDLNLDGRATREAAKADAEKTRKPTQTTLNEAAERIGKKIGAKVSLNVLSGGKGGRSIDNDERDEQDAESPEEAEKLREQRLAREREDRITNAVGAALAKVKFDRTGKSPDKRKAMLKFGKVEIVERAPTDEKALAKVSKAVRKLIEADEAAARAKAADNLRKAEVAKLAKEQAADDKATKKRTLTVPKGAPKPKSHKSTASADVSPPSSGAEVEGAGGSGEAPPAPGGDGPECEPGCSLSHVHSKGWTAF